MKVHNLISQTCYVTSLLMGRFWSESLEQHRFIPDLRKSISNPLPCDNSPLPCTLLPYIHQISPLCSLEIIIHHIEA